MWRLLFLFVFLLSFPVLAQSRDEEALILIDLAEDRVDITTGFTGARLMLFGVKKAQGDIAIVVKGPPRPMVVRHKEKLFGMWMNREAVSFRHVPSYYDLALSAREQDLLTPTLRREQGIGLDSIDFQHKGREKDAVVTRFKEALIRNKQGQGHYPLEAKTIYFLNDNFFRTDFYLPADLPTGEYVIHAFLLGAEEILDHYETRLRVGQTGFSARLYNFAYRHSVLYGLMAILLAVLAGGGAYIFMRRD